MESLAERPLQHYRVVELPGIAPLLFGKTFADLGADVIKIEPPEGDPARHLGPFIDGRSDPDASLFWAAYSLGKRSVTANLETEQGRALVRRLVTTADVVAEAFTPGVLDSYGLSYKRLHADNPKLVMASLTPFGQTGPYSRWRGADLVHFAMSGYLYMTGPGDGPPIKPSAPFQTFLHGSMHAVAATLLALRQRRRTGRGAHIDQAMRDTGLWMLTHTYQHWDIVRMNLRRQGASRQVGSVLRPRAVYQCKDGHIVWMFVTGHIGGPGVRALVRWMAAESMAPDWLEGIDWMRVDLFQTDPTLAARLEAAFGAFFATKTKAELLSWAIENGIMLAPVQTLVDVLDDSQLVARETWRSVDLGERAGTVRVPGPPVQLSNARWEPRGGPPGIGAHNEEVYGKELGLTPDQLAALRDANAV